MKDRPILFSAPMVRALLDGRKTITRRLAAPVNAFRYPGNETRMGVHSFVRGRHYITAGFGAACESLDFRECPYGEPGDRLWVRETWAVDRAYDDLSPKQIDAMRRIENLSLNVWTAADCDMHAEPEDERGRWRPSIFCMQWSSRINLRVTSVRVERLQDITEGDARAEGIVPLQMDGMSFLPRFMGVWDVINGKRASWSSNPWIWRIEFEVVR